MKIITFILLTFFVACELKAQIDEATDSLAPEVNMHIEMIEQEIHVDIETITLQANARIDIIALARLSAYEKDFEKADRLLSAFCSDHINIDAFRLHAQVLYWMKFFDRSTDVYEEAIRLFPEPSILHLEYARLSYNLSRLIKAGQLLNLYRKYDSSNAEADIMTAYMELWNGKIGSAEKKANMLLQKYPANAEAKDILSKVGHYTVPYIKTALDILSDDQPLNAKALHVEGGVYKSWLFSPTIQSSFYQFKTGDSSYYSNWIQVANSIQLGTENKIKLQGGFFQQNNKASAITGSVEVSRKIVHDFLLQAALERRPYQHAVASIKTVVIEGVSTISLSYNHSERWLGKAAYELLSYRDANKIHTAYLWILAPVLSRTHYTLSGGYAFRYADAIENTFVSKAPMSEWIASPTSGSVAGVYSPYFTPENQMVHAALASIKIIPSKKVEFSSRISIGLLAHADNPYIWVKKTGNKYAFQKDYTKENFMQATWVNELRVAASDRFFVAANYSYDKLLYYTSHKGGIALKYHFLK